MKVINKVPSLVALALCLALPSISYSEEGASVDAASFDGVSGGDTGAARLTREVLVKGNGIIALKSGSAWPNPDSCTYSGQIVIAPKFGGVTNEFYSEQYALAVASYLQGKKISAYVSGCKDWGDGTTRPRITSITSYQ